MTDKKGIVQNISNKIPNINDKALKKVNLLTLAIGLIILNPFVIGVSTFNIILNKATSDKAFISRYEKKIKKIDGVIDGLHSLPDDEIDEEVIDTIKKLHETKTLYQENILRYKEYQAKAEKKTIKKKALKLNKSIKK